MSSVSNANKMFQGATKFNQDLCAWQDGFPYGVSEDIFLNSGCTIQTKPRSSLKGPFCASDCIEETVRFLSFVRFFGGI